MLIIPPNQLSDDALLALLEEFVTRQGAIQGAEIPLERKVAQVRALVATGHASIVWDEEHEEATILLREEIAIFERGEASDPIR